MAEVKFEIDISEPDEELLEYAKKHINENPDDKLQIVEEFRNLIFERGECTPYRLDDEYLLRFLRARSYVVRHAHRLMVNYYQFKENHPEYYTNVTFDRLTAIGDANIVATLPFLNEDGRRILYYRGGLWDPKEISLLEMYQATVLALEFGTLEPRSQILGGICIFDMAGISMGHIRYLTPKLAKLAVDIIVSIYPLRTHAVHVVNQPPVFKAGYSIVKPFLSNDVKKRIFFHGSDYKSLHDHIGPKYLPENLGGVHPNYDYRKWIDHIRTNEKVKQELNDLGYTLVEQAFGKDDVIC